MTTNSESALKLAHLRLSVTDLAKAVSFFEALGARPDTERENFRVVELSDKTRLQLTQSDGAVPTGMPLQFDFKVEDIDAAWQKFDAKGLKPEEITRRNPGHDSFILRGPDSCEIKINSGFKRS
jgi:catechol 2,3-dioxygenase-like lactoylglutathione lyase family enzyme